MILFAEALIELELIMIESLSMASMATFGFLSCS